MLFNNIGNINYNISKIGLGTVQFGLDYGFTKKKTQDEVNSILETAVLNDITLIDTAREYGDSEQKIGNFMENYKNNFLIATKLRLIDNLDDLNYSTIYKSINNSVNESLDNLNLNKIPILQLHQSVDKLYSNDDFWTVIMQLKEDNLIDLFGVSVYEIPETSFILENYGTFVDFFQIPYNIFDRRFENIQKDLLEKNIGLISRSTFLKGIIPCDIKDIPNGLELIKPYKENLLKLSEKYDVNVADLAMGFVYYNKFINSTILGVNSSEELDYNIKCVEKCKEVIFENMDFNKLKVDNDYLIDPRKWDNF